MFSDATVEQYMRGQNVTKDPGTGEYSLAKIQATIWRRILLNVQDSIEQSLDILDERYESMSKILEIPIFFDSVEVRQVVDDIRVSRDSILKIANSLVSVDKKDELVDD